MSASSQQKDASLAEWVINDPGSSAAIPNEKAGVAKLITAGAETRTLAAPVRVGVILTLALATDGGDCVVTVASPVNQANNNTLTGADVGDAITLISSYATASTFEWRILANDGWALSTV